MRRVYLDHNATTPMRKEVIDEMLPYFDRIYANPETLHSFGQEAAEALSAARRKVAKLINCASNEVYFTSGGSEANNMFIKGVAFRRLDKKGHIITSAIEHSAVLSVVRFLVDEFGFEATYIEPDRNGIISPTEFEKAIKHDSFIASIMYVNNRSGPSSLSRRWRKSLMSTIFSSTRTRFRRSGNSQLMLGSLVSMRQVLPLTSSMVQRALDSFILGTERG